MGTVIAQVDDLTLQATQYTVSADAVSLNPADTNAGVGGISISAPLHTTGLGNDWKFLFDSDLAIQDGYAKFAGVVVSARVDNRNDLTISAEGPLRALNTEAVIKPFQGSLSQCLNHIFQSVDTSIILQIDPDVALDPQIRTVPAFSGAVWPYLRDFLVVNRLIVTNDSVNRVIVTRAVSPDQIPYETSTAPQLTTLNEYFDGNTSAEQVEVEWYGNEYVTNRVVYPVRDEEPSTISIGINEVAVIELPITTGMLSVNQPNPIDLVKQQLDYSGTNGVYSVFGDDSYPVSAASWVASGASVKVDIKPDDPYTLLVTVTGPNKGSLASTAGGNTLAPFHIAASDNENMYPTLRVTGTGVMRYTQKITLDTGADDATAVRGVGTTLQNMHVATLSDAYDIGLRLSQAYSGATIKMDISLPFNHTPSFTQLQGSLIQLPDGVYRVDSASYSQNSVSLNTTLHTTFAKFDARWAGKTFGEFDTLWNAQRKHRFHDQGMAPLR